MARLGKVTGISSVLVPAEPAAAAASAPTALTTRFPAFHLTLLCVHRSGMDGGFNGISKPAVARRKEQIARHGFIRNHKFIFSRRLDRCLSPYLHISPFLELRGLRF